MLQYNECPQQTSAVSQQKRGFVGISQLQLIEIGQSLAWHLQTAGGVWAARVDDRLPVDVPGCEVQS